MSGKFHGSFAAGDVNLPKKPWVSARLRLTNVRGYRLQTVHEINSARSVGPLYPAIAGHPDIHSGEYRLVGLTPPGDTSC